MLNASLGVFADDTVYSGTVTFSEPAGIYESGIILSLSTDLSGGTIYYTTDGSEPTLDNSEALEYTSPISISKTSTKSTYVSGTTVKAGTVVKAAAY